MTVNYPGGSLKFVYKKGELFVDGVHIKMVPSSSSMHPSSDGWMKFTYKEIVFYFKKTEGGSFKLEMEHVHPQGHGMQFSSQEGPNSSRIHLARP